MRRSCSSSTSTTTRTRECLLYLRVGCVSEVGRMHHKSQVVFVRFRVVLPECRLGRARLQAPHALNTALLVGVGSWAGPEYVLMGVMPDLQDSLPHPK